MATIATTTNAAPFQFPGMTLLTRHPTANVYICLVKASTADNYALYKSTDSGSSWALLTTIVRANLVDVGQIFADKYGWLFWAYRTNESSTDKIYVRVINSTDGTVYGEVLVGSAGNGGVAGSYYSGLDIKTQYFASNATHYVVVAVGTNIGANQGVSMMGAQGAANALHNANLFSGSTSQWLHAGTAGRVGPSMDLQHNGNGYDANPHLWVVYGRTHMKMVRIPWNGAQWVGSPGETMIYANVGNVDQMRGRWDGNRFYMSAPDPVNTTQVMLFERNLANSTTYTHRSQAHTTGVVRNASFAYDPNNDNVRVWAVGTSTAVLYQCDYNYATDTWTVWASTGLTAILGTNADNYGAKSSSSGDAKWGLYTAASGAPNTLTYTPISLSYAPNTPTWVSPNSSIAADVAVSLPLTWAFSDKDPGDTQGSYAVSKQVGAGALTYWRASDSTWQTSEVQNTSSTSAITIPSSWALATDANHTFKVKVWDSNNNASGYSAGLIIIPSTPVNPTITSPTAAQVLGTNQVTVVWTATEQQQFRVLLNVTSGAQVYDSGWFGDSVSRSYLIPYVMPTGGNYTITLYTTNNEGLSSAAVTRQFTTNFTPPPASTLVLTPSTSLGVIQVAITNPAPSGAQPTFGTQEVWRRSITTGQSPINTNPYFETDATGWTATNCTLVRSTSQFHQGVASGFITPNGTSADVYAEVNPHYVFPSAVTFRAQGWIRPTTANKFVSVYLLWFDNGNAFLSSNVVTSPGVAGAWLYVSVEAAPPVNAARVAAALGLTGTPAVGDTAYIDEVALLTADTNAGVRLATGLASGVTFSDFKSVHGVAYEYRSRVFASTGVSADGAWTQ